MIENFKILGLMLSEILRTIQLKSLFFIQIVKFVNILILNINKTRLWQPNFDICIPLYMIYVNGFHIFLVKKSLIIENVSQVSHQLC